MDRPVRYECVRRKPIETQGIEAVAHDSTMFSQLLKLVPRHEFEKLASEHRSGHGTQAVPHRGGSTR